MALLARKRSLLQNTLSKSCDDDLQVLPGAVPGVGSRARQRQLDEARDLSEFYVRFLRVRRRRGALWLSRVYDRERSRESPRRSFDEYVRRYCVVQIGLETSLTSRERAGARAGDPLRSETRGLFFRRPSSI